MSSLTQDLEHAAHVTAQLTAKSSSRLRTGLDEASKDTLQGLETVTRATVAGVEGVTKEVGGGVVKIADVIKKSPDVLEQVAVTLTIILAQTRTLTPSLTLSRALALALTLPLTRWPGRRS